jgi:cyclophilin family peptidyl-prolyl cis-trans isomerase
MLIPLAALLLALSQAAATEGVATEPSPSPTPKPLPNGPVVVLETSMGRIRIGLHKDKAPITVDNFIKYVRSGHYDGTIFHRVIPNFMAQGGGYEPDMSERPMRPPIRNEAKNGLRNLRGTVAMARLNAPDTATAQFFLNVKDNPLLDFGVRGAGYAVFGEIVEGMDVLDKIMLVPTTSKAVKGQPFENVPSTPVLIKRAREEGGAGTAPSTAAPVPAKPGGTEKPAPTTPAKKKPSPSPVPKP